MHAVQVLAQRVVDCLDGEKFASSAATSNPLDAENDQDYDDTKESLNMCQVWASSVCGRVV